MCLRRPVRGASVRKPRPTRGRRANFRHGDRHVDALVAWLDQMGSVAFVTSAGLLVLIDITALAAVAVARDRRLVNRWTGRILGANLVLLGAGLGIPLVAFTTRTVVSVVRPLIPTSVQSPRVDDRSAVRKL